MSKRLRAFFASCAENALKHQHNTVLHVNTGKYHAMDLEGISKEYLNQAIDILSGYMKNFSPYSVVSLEQANEMIGAVPDRVKPALQKALTALLGMGAGANTLNIPNLKVAWIIPLRAKIGKMPIPEIQ